MPNERDDRPALMLATVRGPLAVAPRADLVSKGSEATALWERRRHRTVLADFGALADRMTGVQLAHSIRAQCAATEIYLLSDDPRPEQQQWGMSRGANAVIRRDAQSIGERLPAAERSDFTSSFPAAADPHKVAAWVGRRLNEAGLGPAATLAVEDAMQRLLRRNGGLPFSASELAREVSREINDDRLREAFVRSLGGRS